MSEVLSFVSDMSVYIDCIGLMFVVSGMFVVFIIGGCKGKK